MHRSLLLAGLCLVALSGCRPPEPEGVVLVVDTLRADHLGTNGYAKATSARLDSSTQEGRVFERELRALGYIEE